MLLLGSSGFVPPSCACVVAAVGSQRALATFGGEDVLLAHGTVAFDLQPGVNALLMKFMSMNMRINNHSHSDSIDIQALLNFVKQLMMLTMAQSRPWVK